MKLIIRLMFVLAICMLIGCNSYKNVPYFKDADLSGKTVSQNNQLYDARIMPKDLLSITVSSSEPETAAPFNQTIPTVFTVENRSKIGRAHV